ncbi:MAG: hypothetical protein PHU25_08335 [Deltaproteobacteria bacterium]|nr:hypothetical protein [Deltaproteobacteria bacterium]
MASRIQVVLQGVERERFREEAKKAGMSLSAWMAAAAREKMGEIATARAIDSAKALKRFFAECDSREQAPEPSWDEHLRVIERSRGAGGGDS